MFSFFSPAPGKPYRSSNETIKLVMKDLASFALVLSPLVLLWSSSFLSVPPPPAVPEPGDQDFRCSFQLIESKNFFKKSDS